MFDSRRFSLCSVKNVDGKSGCKILQVSEMLYSLVSSASAAATAIIIVVLVNANSSTTHQKQWHKRKGRYKMWTLPLLHMIKSVFGVCVCFCADACEFVLRQLLHIYCDNILIGVKIKSGNVCSLHQNTCCCRAHFIRTEKVAQSIIK